MGWGRVGGAGNLFKEKGRGRGKKGGGGHGIGLFAFKSWLAGPKLSHTPENSPPLNFGNFGGPGGGGNYRCGPLVSLPRVQNRAMEGFLIHAVPRLLPFHLFPPGQIRQKC